MCPPPRADTPTNNGELAFHVPTPRVPQKHRGERGHARCATAGLGPLARGTANHRRENDLPTQHSTRPALAPPPVEAISLGTQPASLRCALAFDVPHRACVSPHLARVPSPRACPLTTRVSPSPRACPLTTRVSPQHRGARVRCTHHRACCRNTGENADTRAALPRVWARSLGGQRTTGERTTPRPNTQPGLPSHHHLWKLPRSEPSPRRSAARWRSMCLTTRVSPHHARVPSPRACPLTTRVSPHHARGATNIWEHALDVPTSRGCPHEHLGARARCADLPRVPHKHRGFKWPSDVGRALVTRGRGRRGPRRAQFRSAPTPERVKRRTPSSLTGGVRAARGLFETRWPGRPIIRDETSAERADRFERIDRRDAGFPRSYATSFLAARRGPSASQPAGACVLLTGPAARC